MKNKTYYVPLMLIFCLFFLWAISSNLLPTMIRQLMKTCELNAFEASFTETAYWLAYFICPIPIAMFMKKYSYKSGIIFGLLLAACGGLLFFPAAMLKGKLVKGLQIYANGTSLLTLAKERKYMEMNVGTSPQCRSYALGVKVDF